MTLFSIHPATSAREKKHSIAPRRGTPLWAMRYVPPQRVLFLRRFGLKMGLDFAHFAVESGIVLEKTKRMYERIQEPITWHIIDSIPNE